MSFPLLLARCATYVALDVKLRENVEVSRRGDLLSALATYAIKGFLYQFNKTLLEILRASPNQRIVVEGPVEDIHVETVAISGQAQSITAIQCKYHETASKFSASALNRPILQMLAHYASSIPGSYQYVLFAHFGVSAAAEVILTEDDLKNTLASQDKSLKKIIADAKRATDLRAFLGKLRIEAGPSYVDLEKQV